MQSVGALKLVTSSVQCFYIINEKNRTLPTYHMFHSGRDLGKNSTSCSLVQFSLVRNTSEQFATRRVFHYDVQLGERFDHFIKSDYIGMMEFLHRRNFPR